MSTTSCTMTTKLRSHSPSAAYWQRKLSPRAIQTTPVLSCSIWFLWIGHNNEKDEWCGRPGPRCRVSSRKGLTFARNTRTRGSLQSLLRVATVHLRPALSCYARISLPGSAVPDPCRRYQMRSPNRASELRKQFRRQPPWSVLPDPALQKR